MSTDDQVPVVLTRDEWAVVQEALDEYYYQVEHSDPGGFHRQAKERRVARREHLLATLPRLDVAIADQAGVGPLFGGH